MNTNETPVPAKDPQPAPTPTPEATTAAPKKMTGRTKLALWLLIAPTGLWILTIILNIVSATIASVSVSPAPYYSSAYADPPVQIIAISVVSWILGVIAFLTWLPGLITGIILLATKK